MKGTVKFFNSAKEFGFITGEDGKDFFVHKTGLQEGVSIDEGDSVTFETEKGDRGMKAVKVAKA
ncbi:MAG: cold shock domain-containing protein [Nanoarchaeota archaeon]|nr:cold shock domain-containing protein [Nanoarchaeota archaeon]MBU4116396.1 cold shock domain-containing protein [Nanoarchaeota archaeon]